MTDERIILGKEAFFNEVEHLPDEVLDLLPLLMMQRLADELPEREKRHALRTAAIRRNVRDEGDRGTALYLTSYVDQVLHEILDDFLVDAESIKKGFFEGNGPLSTFSSRIDLAYLLGLIDQKARSDLNLLRKIRNEFAHNHENISFETPQIKSRILNFKLHVPNEETARARFISTAMSMIAYLSGTTHGLSRISEKFDYDMKNEKAAQVWEKMAHNGKFDSLERIRDILDAYPKLIEKDSIQTEDVNINSDEA
ncbi:Mannitol repressor [Deinococcus reticulitermitis]|uniref:Mannitol repressor n=1 Tax=Deinococcus reticulitermitis TaxID=856736 RepID=A0A1H6SJW4_9DEIO|nr:MltR family transcriptional regulator [Deinococcus reticulitermitis]SEI65167.1 Mannitol repressor [Deinococcus reticulitermitis]